LKEGKGVKERHERSEEKKKESEGRA